MSVWLIVLAVFVIGAGLVGAAAAGINYLPEHLTRRRIDARMRETGLGLDAASSDDTTVVKREREGPLKGLEEAIGKTRGGGWLSHLIEQSGARVSAGTIILVSLFCAFMSAVAAAAFVRFFWAPIAAGLLGALAPFAILRHRRSKRMHRFEEQFPEVLDLLSRAIRAGHAFTTAMGMVADELPEPVGPEFKKGFDQQNF